ncbi:hypothetical protein OROGR_033074 [Orobanche gracilis]
MSWKIISDEIEAGGDPLIAPFYVSYRKPYPAIPIGHPDINDPIPIGALTKQLISTPRKEKIRSATAFRDKIEALPLGAGISHAGDSTTVFFCLR